MGGLFEGLSQTLTVLSCLNFRSMQSDRHKLASDRRDMPRHLEKEEENLFT